MSSVQNKLRILILFCLLVILFSLCTAVFAQSSLTLRLSQPELLQFPKVALYLDIYDQLGGLVSNLNLNSFRVFEDNQEQMVNEASLIQPGLETIITLNLSSTLSNPGANGSRFQEMDSSLLFWLNSLPVSTSADLYSLISNDGKLAERQKDRVTFIRTLQGYQPNLFNFKPTLDGLETALQLAAQPNQVAHSKQAIFFLTALPVDSELGRIPDLINQATKLHVPVFVWLVAEDSSSNSAAAVALTSLASQTGGQYFLFSPSAQAPDPETYFAPLRSTYRLRYTSSIHVSGSHKVFVQVQYGDQQVKTPEVNFNITLMNPVSTFQNLPTQITRTWITDPGGNTTLQPKLLTLQVNISFPDGYPRQLKAARLLVDGRILVENTQVPFEYFGWSLDAYPLSGYHTLQVEVEDILGFRGQSLPVIVPITVQPRVSGPIGQLLEFIRLGGWIILVALALSGGGYYTYRRRGRIREVLQSVIRKPAKQDLDPLTQPVDIPQTESDLIQTQSEPNFRNDSQKVMPATACLVWAGEKEPPAGKKVIPLSHPLITIGRDPQHSSVVLKLHSIENQQAVITVSPEGQVIIANRSQKSGTYVNYAPISTDGAVLQNGDLVGFGQVVYRFEVGQRSRIAVELDNM